MRENRTRLIAILFLINGLVSGCVSTELPFAPLEPAVVRLATVAEHGVNLRVTVNTSPLRLGHQYLFLAIPFGSISLPHPSTVLTDALYRELAVAGIRAVPDGNEAGLPTLTVSVRDLSTSAYDLLFVRRVTASAELSAILTTSEAGSSPLGFDTSGESSSFERFGFKPQLEAALGGALAEAAREVAITLQSLPPFRYHRRSGAPSPGEPSRGTIIRRSL
jgi:hypothetical protein